MPRTTIDSFETAFLDSGAGAVRCCACGRIFYNPGNGWTWEDGEEERLAADPNATAVDYSVESLTFEGAQYVPECTCWQARARRIIAFIDAHAAQIVAYLKAEKARKLAEADDSPVLPEKVSR